MKVSGNYLASYIFIALKNSFTITFVLRLRSVYYVLIIHNLLINDWTLITNIGSAIYLLLLVDLLQLTHQPKELRAFCPRSQPSEVNHYCFL